MGRKRKKYVKIIISDPDGEYVSLESENMERWRSEFEGLIKKMVVEDNQKENKNG